MIVIELIVELVGEIFLEEILCLLLEGTGKLFSWPFRGIWKERSETPEAPKEFGSK